MKKLFLTTIILFYLGSGISLAKNSFEIQTTAIVELNLPQKQLSNNQSQNFTSIKVSKSEYASLYCWVLARKVRNFLRDNGMSSEDASTVADAVKILCEVFK